MEPYAAEFAWRLNMWLVFLVILILFATSSISNYVTKKKKNLPPGPVGLPVLGYLPFLGKEPYKTFNNLSKQYGNVFSLYLGQTYVVILNDFAAVKEAFSKSETLGRPPKLFDILPDGAGFASRNGQEWVEQRRYSMRTMRDLGLAKTAWEEFFMSEVEEFLKIVDDAKGKPVDIAKLLTPSIANYIASLVYGKRIPRGHPLGEFLGRSVEAFSSFFSQTGVYNYFPLLRSVMAKLPLASFNREYRDMVAFNNYIKNEVEKHKKSATEEKSGDFIDNYLEEIENKESTNSNSSFNAKNLHGNVQALLVGAIDTSKTALNWLFLIMAEYPDIQRKVHNELDNTLQDKMMVKWEDRSTIPYTYSVIMEAQRWKSIVPVNTSRMTLEDTHICGYYIPKGTTIIANNWALHNDPKYWENPGEFIPERFLKDDGKQVIQKPDSYVPFSYGRRNCPGETVAMTEILLYFTAMMHRFEVRPPEGQKIKLEGNLGLLYRAVDQEIRFIPRH